MQYSNVPETQMPSVHRTPLRTPKKRISDLSSPEESLSEDSISECLLRSPEMVNARYGNKFYPACKIGEDLYRWDENGTIQNIVPSDIGGPKRSLPKKKSAKLLGSVETSSGNININDAPSSKQGKVKSPELKSTFRASQDKSAVGSADKVTETWVLVKYQSSKWYPALLVEKDEFTATIRWKASGKEQVISKNEYKLPKLVQSIIKPIECKWWGEWKPATSFEEYEGGFLKIRLQDGTIDFRPVKETRESASTPDFFEQCPSREENSTLSDEDRTPEQKSFRKENDPKLSTKQPLNNEFFNLHSIEDFTKNCPEEWVLVKYAPKKWYPALLVRKEDFCATVRWNISADDFTVPNHEWKPLEIRAHVSYPVETKTKGIWEAGTAIREYKDSFCMIQMSPMRRVVRHEKEIRRADPDTSILETQFQIGEPHELSVHDSNSNSPISDDVDRTPEQKLTDSRISCDSKSYLQESDLSEDWILAKYRSKTWYPAKLVSNDITTVTIRWHATDQEEVLMRNEWKKLIFVRDVRYNVAVRCKAKWLDAVAVKEFEGGFVMVNINEKNEFDVRPKKELRAAESMKNATPPSVCDLPLNESSPTLSHQPAEELTPIKHAPAKGMLRPSDPLSVSTDINRGTLSPAETAKPVEHSRGADLEWILAKYASKLYPARLVSLTGNTAVIEWPQGESEVIPTNKITFLDSTKEHNYNAEARIQGSLSPVTVLDEYENGWIKVRKCADRSTCLIKKKDLVHDVVKETQLPADLVSTPEKSAKKAKNKHSINACSDETPEGHASPRRLFDSSESAGFQIGQVYKTVNLDQERFKHPRSIGTKTPQKTSASMEKKSHYIQITGIMNRDGSKDFGKVIGEVLLESKEESIELRKSGIIRSFKMSELLLEERDRPLICSWADLNHIFVWDPLEG